MNNVDDNGKSNAIGLDWNVGWLEVANLESREENVKNDKRGAQKPYVASSHNHAKILHDCANWTEWGNLCCGLRRMFK